MPILHSFEENKLEYENEDAVEIKIMGTEIDKESLEHNLYENDITPIICHNFSPTSNPPIKPKDSGSFRMKEITNGNLRAGIFEEKKKKFFFTDPKDDVRINPDGVASDPADTAIVAGDGVAGIKRCRRDLSIDGVRNLVTTSKRGQPKETLEDFVSRD
ncbi:hypothetical protein Tco_0300686 [Tanacetum coccineum]